MAEDIPKVPVAHIHTSEAAINLDLVMRQLIDAQQELKTHQSSLNSLKQSILREEAQVRNSIIFFTPHMTMLMRILG